MKRLMFIAVLLLLLSSCATTEHATTDMDNYRALKLSNGSILKYRFDNGLPVTAENDIAKSMISLAIEKDKTSWFFQLNLKRTDIKEINVSEMSGKEEIKVLKDANVKIADSSWMVIVPDFNDSSWVNNVECETIFVFKFEIIDNQNNVHTLFQPQLFSKEEKQKIKNVMKNYLK